ncbi:transposase [Halobacillus andaensis]|nr:transposase [Halobacillus andaensis]
MASTEINLQTYSYVLLLKTIYTLSVMERGQVYPEDNGRPSLAPYFHGNCSERELEQQIQTNVAYRWFLRLNRLSNEGKWISYMRKEKVKEQVLMTADCKNMRKTVLHLARVSLVKESLFLSSIVSKGPSLLAARKKAC